MNDSSRQTLPKMLPVRLRESTYQFLSAQAERRERSKAWIIRRALERLEGEDEDFLKGFLD